MKPISFFYVMVIIFCSAKQKGV